MRLTLGLTVRGSGGLGQEHDFTLSWVAFSLWLFGGQVFKPPRVASVVEVSGTVTGVSGGAMAAYTPSPPPAILDPT